MSEKADVSVFLPSNFGDVLLTLPALAHLHAARGCIDAVVSPATAAFVARLPFVRSVDVYDKKMSLADKARFFLAKRGAYGVFVDFRHTLASLAVGAAQSSPLLRAQGEGHKARQYLSLAAETIGVPAVRTVYWPREREFAPMNAALEGLFDGKAVFAVPCSKSALKTYPPQAFAAFLSRLAGTHRVVLIGGKEDVTAVSQLKAALHADLAVTDLVGKTDFIDLFALMQRHALCVVTADTAPMHAASFLNIPTLALFGPTDPVLYGPYAEGSAVLRAKTTCAGCMLAKCPKGLRCMDSIDPDDVYRALQGVMPQQRRDAGSEAAARVELPRRFR